jgi:hypothetical protein
MRDTRTFTKTEYGTTFNSEAYTDDGKVWRWASNNACVPMDCYAAYGIPADPQAQAEAIRTDTDRFLTEYRDRMKDRRPSREEIFEIEANHEAGTTVIDALTGHTLHRVEGRNPRRLPRL